MFPAIVADIGGTNARFALAKAKEGSEFEITDIRILNGRDYPTFSDALKTYIDGLDGVSPKSACVAIAGPIEGDHARMTNLNWAFSQADVKREFKFEQFATINDYAALAIATSRLTEEHLVPIKSGFADPVGNKAILGPGTGLGVAGLARAGTGWLPIPGEGGHVNVPATTVLECEVLKAAVDQHGYVSAEMFVSGPGMVNLYRALVEVKDHEAEVLEPSQITERALNGSDALCRETLELFCGFTGSVASNVALTYGAKGGVYLAGGILPRFIDFLRQSPFVERFSQKGVMSHYVADIPVGVINHEQTAFLGCAAWLMQFQ